MRYFLADIDQGIQAVNASGWKYPILVGFLEMVSHNFDGIGNNPAFFAMNFVWFCNFVLGTFVALQDSWEGGPNKWCPSKVASGIFRWVAFLMAFGGAHLVRSYGLGYLGSCVEGVVILAEATRLIKNWGIVTGNEKIANLFAKAGEELQDKVASKAGETINKIVD